VKCIGSLGFQERSLLLMLRVNLLTIELARRSNNITLRSRFVVPTRGVSALLNLIFVYESGDYEKVFRGSDLL